MTVSVTSGQYRARSVQRDEGEISPAAGFSFAALTPIQRSATELFDDGFNVLPIPRVGMELGGNKPPYGPFSGLFTCRLDRAGLPVLFHHSNLAILCGRLSRNLFVMDCDEQQAFDRVGRNLERRGIAAWAVVSARGGHYWLLCAEGEVRNDSEVLPGVQIIGNRKYVVAPPSVHPSGLIYEWTRRDGELPAVVSLHKLDFIPDLALVTLPRGELPSVAHQVLVRGDASGYATNSESELAA